MNLVGSLSISARYAGGALANLAVRLERPPVVKLFLGQEPRAVERTVPRLYTLCSQAQGAASRAALAAALGEDGPVLDSTALWAEALHEHLWRLLLDWPLALGLPQARNAFIAWRGERSGGRLEAATETLVQSILLGIPAAAWLAGGAPAADSLAARCLDRLGARENVPVLDPLPLQPGPWLAYWRDGGSEQPAAPAPGSVAEAWRQRLGATLAAAQALAEDRPYPVAAAGGDGWGIGQTLTARGLLTHGVEISLGKVKDYRVWAPTDRLFAGAAPLAGLLGKGPWPDREVAKQALEQAILALDPCLPYTVKVENA